MEVIFETPPSSSLTEISGTLYPREVYKATFYLSIT